MKQLKFHPDLVALVLSGEKSSSWRLFDDKDLQAGDELQLVQSDTLRPFAEAKITRVIVKLFKELAPEDKIGHETFLSETEMYQAYSGYYRTEVGPDTQVKVLWFDEMQTL